MVDEEGAEFDLIAHHLSEALKLADKADLLVAGALISYALHEIKVQGRKW